jgi:DNA repair protein RAD50
MQVTVKKGTNAQMKTLDCHLLINKDGERTTLSSKVADMDKIMPQYIGVSQAVLDNVIFCHQDESLWPMSEPSVLKKKFDEIFEALKYTAAMKNINELQKQQKIELGQWQIRHDAEKENKDRGDRAQQRSVKLSEEIEEQRSKLDALRQDIKIALQTKEEKWRQATKALGIVDQLKTKQQRAQNLQENINNLIPNLEELEESDEWLRSTLDRYEERVGQYEARQESLLAQWNELQQSLSTSRKQLSSKQAEMGRRQAEKENCERQMVSRAQLVKVAADQHSLRGYDGELDEDQVREFVDRVRKLSRDKDRELERVKKATEDELREIQAQLNELENRKSGRTQARLNARQAIAENDKRQGTKQREAGAINMDEGVKAELEKAKTDAQIRLRTLNTEYDAAEWDRQLKVANNHQVELETEGRRLMDELKQSNKLASDRAQLEYVKKEAKQTQSKLETMKSTYGAKLNSILGANWQWEDLTHEFQTVLDQRAESIADTKRAQEGTHEQVREVELKLKQNRARLVQKKEEMQKRQKNVLNSITTEEGKPLAFVDDYPVELEALEAACRETQNDLDGMEYVSKYYTKCRDTAVKSDTCQLCERRFTDKKEKSAALAKIDKELEKIKRELLERELIGLKQDLSMAVAARPDYEILKTLSDEISDLEKEIRDLDKSKIPLVKQLELHDSTLSEEESVQSDIGTLANPVKTITEYSDAISKLEAQSSSLSTQHKLSGSSLSAEEIDEQQSACDDRLRSLRAKIEKIANDRDQAKSKISSLEIELGNISNQLNTASHQLEKKQSILSDIEELRRSNAGFRNTIQEADADLESLAPLSAKANVQYEDARKRGRAKEKEIQSDKDKLADTANKFRLVEDDINRYIEQGGPEQLAACQRAIKVLEQEQKRLEGEVAQVTADNNEVKKLLDDSERTKRSINDNILYRKYVGALEEVTKEIADLNSRNVTDDYAQLQREAAKADQRYTLLGVDVASLVSSIKEKDKTLKEQVDLWQTDYKDAAQNYREARVKVGTTQAAIEDLGKYSKALEAAIMKFHSVKMEEINRFAGELWQQTYQGSDIDTIMIRSENENAASKRSYNYRVVMVKSGAEMDMRGRCSAGQKVLASIIIRLALAECFGVNCGVGFLPGVASNITNNCSRSSLLMSLLRILTATTSRPWLGPSTQSSETARPNPTSSSLSLLTTRLSLEK